MTSKNTDSEPIILLIETSGSVCSVALSKGTQLLDSIESHEDRTHAQNLSVFIDNLLRQQNTSYHQLNAIAVSKGPGSYTGLRIGTATAKGICYGANKPLIAINSLQSLVHLYISQNNIAANAVFCPMFDARRMEVYTALFNGKGEAITDTQALIVDENSFKNELNEQKIVFMGDGALKCKDLLAHPNAVFVDIDVSAKGMIALANEAYQQNNVEDVAYFEPFYLKDFLITQSKKKVL